ncbi:MAG: GyrI-like domain-containing protein [Nitrososphaerota archaeon]|nr:GyrI-like domain-containing protein [Nitrososphaerota archaeon]MDG7023247.1 GyrI-like domain-containing protein [Nitrososphaerota archaeon]
MARPEVRSTTSSPMKAAFVERRGAYSGTGQDMLKLKNWIDSKGTEVAGYPFCQYFDNPGENPTAELKSEACIPVSGGFQPEGEFRMKELGESPVAETRHTGRQEEFAKTYGPFLEGLLSQGYSLFGPAREYYMTISGSKGPGSGFLIRQPVARG